MKYPQVVDKIKRIKNKLVEKKETLSPKEDHTVCNWLEDELAFAILINQNSKCNPFKFIKF